MLITFETIDGAILIYDTQTGRLYENMISADTEVLDEEKIEQIRKKVNELLKKYTPPAINERDDAEDAPIKFSETTEVFDDYLYYYQKATEFAHTASKHYIPTTTKMFKLFDAINELLTFIVDDGGETSIKSWKITDDITIVQTTVDGHTVVTINYEGITKGVWETYDYEKIKDYLDALAIKRRKIFNTYIKLAKKSPDYVDVDRIKKAIRALEIYKKLQR